MSVLAIKLSTLAGVAYSRVLAFERAGLINLPQDTDALSERIEQVKVKRLKAIRDLREREFSIKETRRILTVAEHPEATLEELEADSSLATKIQKHRGKLDEIESRLIQAS
ncbi:MAG: MerR family transcriptional regulator [bacterium]